MRRMAFIFLTPWIILAPLKAAATPFDGSSPLLCAVLEVIECGAGGECIEVPAEAAGIPHFLVLDFENGIIRATEESGRSETTEIQNVRHIDGKLILQGAENGRGWSIVISMDSGKMSAAVSDHDVGFIVFGAATIL